MKCRRYKIVYFVKKFPSMEIILETEDEKEADEMVDRLNKETNADLPDLTKLCWWK